VGVNETRPYTAQQIKDGDCFIRLPVGLLGVKKKSKLLVAFTADTITVTRQEAKRAQAVA